jgi:hypothetical protein
MTGRIIRINLAYIFEGRCVFRNPNDNGGDGMDDDDNGGGGPIYLKKILVTLNPYLWHH